MPDEAPKGSASAQASAEAAAGASDILGAAAALPPPTPGAAEPSAPPEPASAEPAAEPSPEGADTHEEEGDYDAEEAEAALGARDAALELPPEHRKLLETHKTPAALAKALYEAQQQLSRVASPAPAAPGTAQPAPAPPAPAAAPQPITREQVEATVQSLAQSDPSVSRLVQEVQGHAAEHADALRQWTDLGTKITASKDAIVGRTHLVQFLTDQAKANPEDFRVKEQLIENRTFLAEMKAEHQELVFERQQQAGRLKQAFDAYEEGRRTVYAHAHNVLSEQNARSMEDAARDTARERTAQEWTSAFPRVMDALKIPANKRVAAEKFLLQAAYANPQDISNIEAWMTAQGKEIADFIGEVRDSSVVQYRRDKKADANQPAPRGQAAVVKETGAPGKPEPRLSSRDASRLAGDGFTRSLQGAR